MTRLQRFVSRKEFLFSGYLFTISMLGLLLLAWGLIHIPSYQPLWAFGLLVALAIVAAFATTSIVIQESGITYQVGSVAVLAAIPVIGTEAAIVISVVFNFAVWYIKPRDSERWKRSWSQLTFNAGMHAIATVVATVPFVLTNFAFGTQTLAGYLIPWLPAAFLYEEVNLWLLIGILRLQHGKEINPWELWRQDRWATQLSIFLLAVGSSALSFALLQYDFVAGIIFFMPVLLSAYAFRLYVQQTQSHLENLEETIAERTSDLAELNEQKDAYLAVLTHDMMTPLSSIRYCNEMIQDDPTISSEGLQLSELVLRSERTLFTLVQNILDIERLATGQELLQEMEKYELDVLVRDTAELMRPEAEEKELMLTVELSNELTDMAMDITKIERVLQNLISNAIKYTPMGGKISIRTWTTESMLCVEVSDNGYGINEVAMKSIFERASRASEVRDKAIGTGLGLSISRSLIEAHNGTLKARSMVGQGSTFTIELPKRVN